MDTVEHTLLGCEAWALERIELSATLGDDLSLPSIVTRISEDVNCWEAFLAFSERVLSVKEEAERARQANEIPDIFAHDSDDIDDDDEEDDNQVID